MAEVNSLLVLCALITLAGINVSFKVVVQIRA
jgi:hypothetical protein